MRRGGTGSLLDMASVHVNAVLVSTTYSRPFAERRRQAQIEFVLFAFGGGGFGVVADGVAGFDALDQCVKCGIEIGDILHIEHFAARGVHHFANVDQAFFEAGGQHSARRIVAGNFQVIEYRVGSHQFGDDVVRAFAAGVSGNVIADQDDHAATVRRRGQQIFRSDENGVIDVGGAAYFPNALIDSATLPCRW